MKDIEDMDMKELLEQGIASEINAQRKYGAVAKENFSYALHDKLDFLKKQEKGHEKELRKLFKKHFPDKEPDIPEKVLKPAPDIEMESEAIGELFKEAMESEKESKKFYEHLADRLDDEELKKTANYLGHMEEGHYKILKHELESMQKFKGRWGGVRAF
ncbi:MAG: ferritin family protein [Candidatus Thermoplasmatota archaeon]